MTLRTNRMVRKANSRSRQPLKPSHSSRKVLWGSGVAVLAVLILLLIQRDQIAGFINRPVNMVRLETSLTQLSTNDLNSMLEPFMGTGFFRLDVALVKAELETHPWVAEAVVKRTWPETLVLQLTEQVAIARWGSDQLLNQYAELFAPEQLPEMPLTWLAGPEGKQYQVMQQYQQLNGVISDADMRLSELKLSERGSWELLINGHLRVSAGRDQVVEKLQRFVEFYQQQDAGLRNRFVAVDLRYSNGIAVQLAEQELTGVAAR